MGVIIIDSAGTLPSQPLYPLMTATVSDPTRHGYAYCPYYCEENIWHLCAHPALGDGRRVVLLVSNAGRQVAVWGQRSAAGPDAAVIWDYHVIAAAWAEGDWWVWDLDTGLGLPLPAADYLVQSFRPVPPRFRPWFRLVGCGDYRWRFASDRRHMQRPDGGYAQPPPDWPAIGDGHNLGRFIDMEDGFVGEVLDLEGLRGWFALNR